MPIRHCFQYIKAVIGELSQLNILVGLIEASSRGSVGVRDARLYFSRRYITIIQVRRSMQQISTWKWQKAPATTLPSIEHRY